VPPNTPLNQAILAAGGFNTRARVETVDLIRLNPNGTVSQQEISVDFSTDVNSDMNPPLRPNDTIVVGRSDITRLDDSLGSVLSPLTGILSILGIFNLL
jgi:polysaccharide export outer membrane protein